MEAPATKTVTREQAEAVLAKVRQQYLAYCATAEETAVMYADDPELVDVLTKSKDGTPKANPPQPTLVENFDWGAGPVPWAIVWEEGPFEWAYNAMQGGVDEEVAAMLAAEGVEGGGKVDAVDPVPGVATEPYSGWALAIYPEEA
jgi:hypothetical protein